MAPPAPVHRRGIPLPWRRGPVPVGPLTPVELGLVLASALLHAWWSVAIKGSGAAVSFNVAQGLAPGVALVLLLPWVETSEIPAPVWRLLAGTGIAHGLYFYWLSRALDSGDLTLVYPIARSTPAFMPLVAVPLMGESISPAGALGIATVVAGMWLVYAGRDLRWSALTTPAARFAALTLAATVAYSSIDKRAMAELAAGPWTSPVPRPLLYCLLLDVAGFVTFTPLATRRLGAAPLARQVRAQLGPASLAALVGTVGYGLTLKALETAPVSYVVAVRQTSVLFALVLGVLWLGERPGRARAIGAAATVVGVALIARAS